MLDSSETLSGAGEIGLNSLIIRIKLESYFSCCSYSFMAFLNIGVET